MADGDRISAPTKFGVGQPMRRKEDDRFLRGAGAFLDDLTLENQAYAAFVRSPHAHALLQGVDVSAAKSAPGVLGVFTHADTIGFGLQEFGNRAPVKNADGSPAAAVTTPHLAKDRVRFVGQPVAMIVADSAAAARDAIELVEVAYEELPVTINPRRARDENAPQLHDEAPQNTAYYWTLGDRAAVEAAFEAAHTTVSTSAPCQRVVINAMETRVVNAVWDGDVDRWTLHCCTQGPHLMRQMLSDQLGVGTERIRVTTPDVGGGFGMKLMVHPEYALCAAAARRVERPVKWTADRSESFLSDAQGRAVDIDIDGAFDAEGKILALRVRQISDLGAHYCQFSAGIHSAFSAALVGGLYDVGAAVVDVWGVFTNKTPMDAYRGAGRPEANYATEMVLDAAAQKLGLDPAELRRRNLHAAGDAPFDTPTGLKVDSANCREVLDRALELADYAGAAERKKEAAERGKLRGVGVSYYVERTGGSPIENARLRVRGDGGIEAWIGTQSTGQGHETAWAQVIHEKLGVDVDRISFLAGDSDLLPAGGGTGGSRSLIIGHKAFFLAADHIIEQGKEAAAEALEAAVADIEFSKEEGGVFRIVGTDRQIDLFALADRATDSFGDKALLGVGDTNEMTSTFPNGAHIAEVEIDPETGEIAFLDYVIVDDFGRILNPLLASGQVHGGVAQGVGQALLELAAFDEESGQPLAGSFMDYAMPRADNIPRLRSTFYQNAPTPTNPLGVKGAGESGSVGATQAVVLAALDALRQAGVEQIETPLTPLKVWSAIQAARA
ncbi:MAG: xanthine dehydrogenase family protein molybdopterin-binding subunit [Neomegalonema sp.]|nr:xanthine dehydrogenase family protein molybdopterin-binding subunit [Neomegalonema sp.]